MARHVSGEDDADEALAESLKVVSREVFQEVVIIFVQDGERLSRVEVLLHRLITVADGAI